MRLISLMHASAMEEISERQDDEEGFPVLDLAGLDRSNLRIYI